MKRHKSIPVIDDTFHDMMCQLRSDAGMTQRHAALLIGCSVTTLKRWEHGPYCSFPRPYHANKIIEVYDVLCIADLFDAAGYDTVKEDWFSLAA
jgi:DNA-binding XRE family transcriptional regulator